VWDAGAQGAGKTTTVAKVAAHYKREGFKTAMVCADTFRAGAFHQLMQNAQKVHVPYYGDPLETDPVKVARAGVEVFVRDKFEVILVDTSGRHKQESELFEEMRQVSEAVKPDEIVFVMDASIGQSAFAQARAFREAVKVGSVIITKLDGHAKGGGALSAVAATSSPIVFYGSGEHFADLEEFDARSFVSKLLGRGDLKGLLRKMQRAVTEEEQEALVKKMSKGKITLRDFREQLEMVSRMGSLNKMMGMMPGALGQMMGQMPEGEGADVRFKRFMVMMDSMSDAELDAEVFIDAPRARRIARGAGVPLGEVQMMLSLFKQFATTMERMGKAGLVKQSDAKLLQQIKRNPNAVRDKLAKAVDPNLVRSLGGADGMMEMMRQLSGGGPAAGGGGGGRAGGPAMGGGGGFGDLAAMAQSLLGGGGAGAGGGMPDLAQLAAALGGGGPGGGMPGIPKRRIVRVGRK
jgi:signal recognition particle subunit SRP54